ncbi:basic proline-rich protein-like [Camelus dromedarius]|uniref:basic proline-rich protein-like n=1 Tax=Camelus dromedarius TaxID=9838 RepID=UPI00311A2D58
MEAESTCIQIHLDGVNRCFELSPFLSFLNVARSAGPALSHQLLVPLCWWRPREPAASPSPPARIPAGPTPPPGCVCKQWSVSRGCWRGAGDWGARREGRGRLGWRRPGRRPRGPRGRRGPFPPRLPPGRGARATALTQGGSSLSGLGHRHHQKDVRMPPSCTVANKFLCDFFFPPRSCSPLNEPTRFPGRRVCTPVRAAPAPPPWPPSPAAAWPGPPGAGQGRRGARPAWPPPPGRPSGTGPPPIPWRAFCVAWSHLSPPHTHTPPGHFPPSRPGRSSLPQANGAQLLALGGGLTKASTKRVRNASGKEMGLHTGLADGAANASWEVA